MKNQFLKEQGITLIALVVTIIILIILAGVSITMLVGENGIISKSLEAKENYTIAELKEHLSLLLQEIVIDKNTTDKDIDFRSEIKGIFENYSIYYDGNDRIRIFTDQGMLLIDENYQIIEDNNSIIYKENIADLKAAEDVKEGDIVYTLGYYTKADNGEAKYFISSDASLINDNGKVIELNNGLKAVLQIENDTVTVEQFGAHGDKNINDYQCFQQAIDSGAKVVCLGNKEFLINQRVVINKNDLTLISYRKNILFLYR